MNWFAKKLNAETLWAYELVCEKIERRDAKAQRNKIREGKGHGAKLDFFRHAGLQIQRDITLLSQI